MSKPNKPVVVTSSSLLRSDRASELVRSFLGGRTPATTRAYAQDLEVFADFMQVERVEEAARRLLSLLPGDANAAALDYRNAMVERGLKAATVNRRLAALRALVKLARTLGLVPWALEIANLKADQDRDLRGPTRGALKRVLHMLEQRGDAKAKRDRAILRLLHDLGLRRGEVASLDLAHVDLAARTLSVLGKGRSSRATLTLPDETTAVLKAWLAARGVVPGPLFTNYDRAKKGGRLTGTSIYRLIRSLGLGRPHGVRHAAITEALDLMGGNVRAVARFSRHADVRVVERYDDCREDLGGQVARTVAANL